jgi:hypothetical protein
LGERKQEGFDEGRGEERRGVGREGKEASWKLRRRAALAPASASAAGGQLRLRGLVAALQDDGTVGLCALGLGSMECGPCWEPFGNCWLVDLFGF